MRKASSSQTVALATEKAHDLVFRAGACPGALDAVCPATAAHAFATFTERRPRRGVFNFIITLTDAIRDGLEAQ